MPFRRLLTVVLAPALMLLAPAVAPAGPIWTINTDAKGGVDRLATVTWTFENIKETGLAGSLTTTLPDGQKVDTYCIDLRDTTYVGNGGSTWTAEVLPLSSFADYASGANWGAIGYLYSTFNASVASRVDGAALQIAIWKVEYDGNGDFTTGSFRLSDSSDIASEQHQVYARANQLFAGFDAGKVDGNETFFRATSHPNGLYQDLVGPGGTPPVLTPNTVPEPTSLAMVACGLGVVAIAHARRTRRR